jgi:predicted nucleic acid-binding protein
MILVDTSVWIDHLRAGDPVLSGLLEQGQVLGHVFVTGELALGTLANRAIILEALNDLPQALLPTDAETLAFIDRHALHGPGIGYVDANLLASVRLTPDTTLWTRDKRLSSAAEQLGLRADGFA